MKVLLSIALLTIFAETYSQIEPFGTEICRLFGNGVKLRNPGSCSSYIVCNNGVGTVKTCTGTKKIYSKESSTCILRNTDSYCKIPCKSKSPKFVADPKTCNGYYHCVGGTGTFDSCPNGLHFNQITQSCVYTEDSQCYGYNYCDVVPNNVTFRNEHQCQQYYMCVKGKLTINICENKGYYDPIKGCIKKSEVECAEHPIPHKICGTAKRPERNKFVSDERTCIGYFWCQDKGENTPDLAPNRGECPSGKFFNYDLQICYTASATKCDEDRCAGRNRSKVISGTKGCQHYLICNGNAMVSEEQCPSGQYFDDDSSECTTEVKKYVACS